MNYALELADPALQGLQTFDIWLQEETLDELDRLAANPPTGRVRLGGLVHDFVRQQGNTIFYVFIVYFPDIAQHTLRVKSIGVHARPAA